MIKLPVLYVLLLGTNGHGHLTWTADSVWQVRQCCEIELKSDNLKATPESYGSAGAILRIKTRNRNTALVVGDDEAGAVRVPWRCRRHAQQQEHDVRTYPAELPLAHLERQRFANREVCRSGLTAQAQYASGHRSP